MSARPRARALSLDSVRPFAHQPGQDSLDELAARRILEAGGAVGCPDRGAANLQGGRAAGLRDRGQVRGDGLRGSRGRGIPGPAEGKRVP